MSTHVRHHAWDYLIRSCQNLRISNDSHQIPATALSHENNTTQATKPQRKRTSDGSIKDGQSWRVDDLRSVLLQAYNDGQISDTRLHMETDMLRRRLAAIEAQEQCNSSPAAPSRQTRTEQQRLAAQQKLQGKCRRVSETEHKMVEWQETVLR